MKSEMVKLQCKCILNEPAFGRAPAAIGVLYGKPSPYRKENNIPPTQYFPTNGVTVNYNET